MSYDTISVCNLVVVNNDYSLAVVNDYSLAVVNNDYSLAVVNNNYSLVVVNNDCSLIVLQNCNVCQSSYLSLPPPLPFTVATVPSLFFPSCVICRREIAINVYIHVKKK